MTEVTIDEATTKADLFHCSPGSDLWVWIGCPTLAEAFEANRLRPYHRSVVRLNFARGESVVLDLEERGRLQFCPVRVS